MAPRKGRRSSVRSNRTSPATSKSTTPLFEEDSAGPSTRTRRRASNANSINLDTPDTSLPPSDSEEKPLSLTSSRTSTRRTRSSSIGAARKSARRLSYYESSDSDIIKVEENSDVSSSFDDYGGDGDGDGDDDDDDDYQEKPKNFVIELPQSSTNGKTNGTSATSTKTEDTEDLDYSLTQDESDGKPVIAGAIHNTIAPLRSFPRRLSRQEKVRYELYHYHPELNGLFEGFRDQTIQVGEKAEKPAEMNIKLLPFQLESLAWMKKQENGNYKGGILADEMGMGKTIQMISLILDGNYKGKHRRTLVIAPTVAIIQWKNEIAKFTQGLKVCVWHGGNRTNDKNILRDHDVVLTSYSILESAYRKQEKGFTRTANKKKYIVKEDSVLHDIKWNRVILDEAHNIKDRQNNTSKAAFALDTTYRWCLSGTPLQNRVGELYSLIRFLGVENICEYFCRKCECKDLNWNFTTQKGCDICGHSPMNHTCLWNHEILKPIQRHGFADGNQNEGRDAFAKLQTLLGCIMIRRTKLERSNDLGLPPRTIMVRGDYFTEEEEELYTSLFRDVRRQFSGYVDADSVLNNYANIFTLITRLRQMACHPDLVLKSKTAKIFDKLPENEEILACRICLDEAEDAIKSRCAHLFCRECIRQYMETFEQGQGQPECPVCHVPISIDLNAEAIETAPDTINRQGILARIDPSKWRTSTKIEALVEELGKLQAEDHSQKSLVFSQYTSFLDLIDRRLQLAGYKVARLQGSMSPEARDRTIKYFMENNNVTVFLLSLKAGGVALNLTEASRVFIMDPWWNPAVELQAMDRIHRLGQHRPIVVTRLVIEDSIESRIIQLQQKKENMIGAALGDDDQALNRLTREDLQFLFSL